MHTAPPLLADLLTDIREQDYISPTRMSQKLRLPLADLARLTHVHRNTLSLRPEAALVQKGLEPIVRILTAAEELTGDADRAVVWFRHQPIAGHDGLTAMDLVGQGHAEAVIAHLQDLRDGAYA